MSPEQQAIGDALRNASEQLGRPLTIEESAGIAAATMFPDRVFELRFFPLHPQCDRCKQKRPKFGALKRIGDDETVSCLCRSCAAVVQQQGVEAARRVEPESEEAEDGSFQAKKRRH